MKLSKVISRLVLVTETEMPMKTMTIAATVVILVGLYIEYQKDSSFASVDAGSLIVGGGVGLLLGGMI